MDYLYGNRRIGTYSNTNIIIKKKLNANLFFNINYILGKLHKVVFFLTSHPDFIGELLPPCGINLSGLPRYAWERISSLIGEGDHEVVERLPQSREDSRKWVFFCCLIDFCFLSKFLLKLCRIWIYFLCVFICKVH